MADEYDTIMVRGKLRYRKNKKIVSKNTLPRYIMEQYGLIGEQQQETEGSPVTDKSCLFCGIHSRFIRFVNGQTIYVCDGHYYSETIGKCAQRLRELNHEKEASKKNDDKEIQEGHDVEDESGILGENQTARQGNSESVGSEVNNRELQKDPES